MINLILMLHIESFEYLYKWIIRNEISVGIETVYTRVLKEELMVIVIFNLLMI